jgi:cold shock CspA family protein
VNWYNLTKGFGFIVPHRGGKDIFVHASALGRAGIMGLGEGQRGSFDVADGRLRQLRYPLSDLLLVRQPPGKLAAPLWLPTKSGLRVRLGLAHACGKEFGELLTARKAERRHRICVCSPQASANFVGFVGLRQLWSFAALMRLIHPHFRGRQVPWPSRMARRII